MWLKGRQEVRQWLEGTHRIIFFPKKGKDLFRFDSRAGAIGGRENVSEGEVRVDGPMGGKRPLPEIG